MPVVTAGCTIAIGGSTMMAFCAMDCAAKAKKPASARLYKPVIFIIFLLIPGQRGGPGLPIIRTRRGRRRLRRGNGEVHDMTLPYGRGSDCRFESTPLRRSEPA